MGVSAMAPIGQHAQRLLIGMVSAPGGLGEDRLRGRLHTCRRPAAPLLPLPPHLARCPCCACAQVGIGNMGAAMATRLLGAGYRLVVCDRNQEAVARLAAAGAKVAPTPAALAATPGARPRGAALGRPLGQPSGCFGGLYAAASLG